MSHPETATDDELLTAAAEDAAAFSAFYRRYERPVLAYFLRRTADAELAADLTAEVFAAVLVGCSRYRPGEAPAHAWLFGIAQHKLAASRRRGAVEARGRRKLGMPALELDDDDLERIERTAGGGALLGLLEDLPAEQRHAVRARIVEEHPYAEIAQRLSCSQAVVRKRVSRGLARLREQLSEEGT
jgi:RNA polymerase sigma factor (sigma-70 family)